MRGRACIAVLILVPLATRIACAQPPATAGQPAQEQTSASGDGAPATGAKAEPAPTSGKPEFPEKKNKKLFATNDYRGRKAPEFKVEKWLTPAGKPAAPDTKGKVVLIDYWATWCGPCKRLIPELNQWQKEFKNDLVVIGISDEPAAKVDEFLKRTTVEYAMAVDTRRNEMTKSMIGIAGIPHVMVIDSTGICRWQGFPQLPEDTLTTEVLRQIIAADKAQRAAPGSEPKPAPAPESPGPGAGAKGK